jgi:hypothetical protein
MVLGGVMRVWTSDWLAMMVDPMAGMDENKFAEGVPECAGGKHELADDVDLHLICCLVGVHET